MRKAATDSLPFLSIRIDFDSEGRIGPGKIELLESIRVCGSISAAGRAMDMSYKRAWELVDEIDRVCGQTAVERLIGGKSGGGAVLTPFGLSLIDRYRKKIERAANDAARNQLQALKSEITKAPKALNSLAVVS
jgi:molybdate transport system regulatory protein